MFKSEIKDTPQNADSTGNYINDFSNISIITYNRNSKYINDSTRNIDLPTKNTNPFLTYEKAAPSGTTSFSIPESSR